MFRPVGPPRTSPTVATEGCAVTYRRRRRHSGRWETPASAAMSRIVGCWRVPGGACSSSCLQVNPTLLARSRPKQVIDRASVATHATSHLLNRFNRPGRSDEVSESNRFSDYAQTSLKESACAKIAWVGGDRGRHGGSVARGRITVCQDLLRPRATAGRPGCDRGRESVVVANDLHPEVVLGLLSAGKNVLCEKPFASTIADAEAMAARRRSPR
jgi:hypothetical protein